MRFKLAVHLEDGGSGTTRHYVFEVQLARALDLRQVRRVWEAAGTLNELAAPLVVEVDFDEGEAGDERPDTAVRG